MSVAKSDARDDSVTISLADVGVANIPETATVTVWKIAPNVYRLARNNHTFEVEIGWRDAELTLEDGRCAERIPGWMSAVLTEKFGVDEVELSR